LEAEPWALPDALPRQMLYAIMVGSFLVFFVPECAPRRRAAGDARRR